MTRWGQEKAAVIRSMCAARKAEGLPALEERVVRIVAGQAGVLLDAGHDITDVRWAACELAITGAPWRLVLEVRTSFPVGQP